MEFTELVLILMYQYSVFQEEHGGHVDQYLVYGEDYKTVREAVAKAIIEGRTQSIDEAVQVYTFCLVFFFFWLFFNLFPGLVQWL